MAWRKSAQPLLVLLAKRAHLGELAPKDPEAQTALRHVEELLEMKFEPGVWVDAKELPATFKEAVDVKAKGGVLDKELP